MAAATAHSIDQSYALRVAALAFFYFAAAKASLMLAIPPGYATAVWPPSGIAFAGLLLWGARAWPGIWLGAAAANYTVSASAPLAAAIATGNTLEGLCAAWLAGRLLGGEPVFREPEAVFLFAAIAAASSVVAATAGVSAISLSGGVAPENFFANWYTWWQGDTTGIILVTPLVLAWTRAGADENRRTPGTEQALFWMLLAATLASVFSGLPRGEVAAAMEFLLIPFMAWAGCRFGERQVTLVVLAAAGTAIWGAIDGRGPYRVLTLNESLLVLQAFASTLALMALVLYAAMQQRADAMQILRSSRDYLRSTVRDRTSEVSDASQQVEETQALAHIGSWTWDPATGRVTLSRELYRICGMDPAQRDGSLEAFLGRLHPGDCAQLKQAIHRAQDDRRPWDICVRLTRPDGGVRVLRSLGEMVVDQGGKAQRLRGTCIDLTETVRLEQSLAACEGRLDDLGSRMQRMLRRIADAQDTERKHVVAELRNRVGRNLAALRLELESWLGSSHEAPGPWTQRMIVDWQRLLERSLESLRGVAADLQPTALEDFSLPAALRACAERLERRTGVAAEVLAADAGVRPHPGVENALLRIAQEAIDNVERHAQARRLRVRLDLGARRVALSIADDGVGFELDGEHADATRGLLVMRERAASVGGELRIESGRARGTTVSVEVLAPAPSRAQPQPA